MNQLAETDTSVVLGHVRPRWIVPTLLARNVRTKQMCMCMYIVLVRS